MKLRVIPLLLAVLFIVLPLWAAAESNGQTVLDLSKGSAIIGDGTLSAYDSHGKKVTTPNPNGYILTGSTKGPEHTVQILSGTHAIILRDLFLQIGKIPEFMEDENVAPEVAAIEVKGGAHVDLTVEGTNTVVSGDNHGGIHLSEVASLTITAESTGTLNVFGGIDGAGIGSGSKGVCGDIAIHGGTILAAGGDDSAGIGCGWTGSCGNITITGGTVTATAFEGSGIGGGGAYVSDGFKTFCGDITITGGTVTAKGGALGAGIGTGMYETCGNITISGGTVYAEGRHSSAGIGGGWTGRVGDITISGGEVTAIGNSQAAGIGCGGAGLGSGYESTCGIITISGGIVHATGGEFCPGVGTAWGGVCEGLTISGGYLTSVGGVQSTGALGNALEGTCGPITISGGYFAQGSMEENTVYGLPVSEGFQVSDLHNGQLWPFHVADHLHQLTLLHSETAHWIACTDCGLEVEGSYASAVVQQMWDEDFHWTECTACGGQIPDSSGAHDLVHIVTEPTHTEDGFTTHACTGCGYSFVDGRVTAPCPSRVYSDVPEGNWYHEAVDYVTEKGIMNGMGDGTFSPAGITNRAMMTMLLYRLAGTPDVAELTEPFEDVEPGQWFHDAVVWAYNCGIVNGQTETRFVPGGELLRGHLVAMLHRYVGSPEADFAVLEPYSDGGTLGFATTAFAWAVSEGLVSGMGDGTLAPTATSNRAQIAVILMRYLEK